ncbi:MAG: thiol reductase thioredoxin [Oceanicaulis sp.]|nr:thiol reductase thioredoxin [Oceanicaulis sp.]
MATQAVTDDTFENDVLKADGPVLVDFWAEWCGPCKQIGPALEEIASEKAGKLTIAKVNIDENPMAPSKYGVRSIPTLLIFKNGEEVSRKVGAMAKSKIEEWINEAV